MRRSIASSHGRIVFYCWLSLTPLVRPDTAVLRPAADTSLFESSANNNLGAYTNLAAGVTETGVKTRALIRFDPAGTLPVGAVIQSVSLTLQVTRTPSNGGVPSVFELRRLNQAWGEGNKTGNNGTPASPGEATWNARLAPDVQWSVGGGAAPGDFTLIISTTNQIGGLGACVFPSTSNLVADVQSWLANPATNFGWILMTQNETTAGTARRFGSREDAADAPLLAIEFSRAAPEFRLTHITAGPTNLNLQWQGGAAPYQLQQRLSLSAPWQTLSALWPTNFASLPISAAQSFFRVSAPSAP